MQVNIAGTLTITNYSQRSIVTLNDAPTISGSGAVTATINLVTGSWTLLPQGTNIDFRLGTFSNNDLTSSVYIALNQTASYASLLQPGDNALLTYSGSANVYAKAVGAHSPVSLSYSLVSYL